MFLAIRGLLLVEISLSHHVGLAVLVDFYNGQVEDLAHYLMLGAFQESGFYFRFPVFLFWLGVLIVPAFRHHWTSLVARDSI